MSQEGASRLAASLALLLAVAFLSASVQPADCQSYNGPVDVYTTLGKLQQLRKYSKWLLYLRASGMDSFLAQYVYSHPITLFAAPNDFFNNLPLRTRLQLKGQKIVKLLQFNMVLNTFPSKAMLYFSQFANYPTVLGPPLFQLTPRCGNTETNPCSPTAQPTFGTNKSTVVMRVVQPDVTVRLLILSMGVDKLAIPPRLFT